MKEIPVFEAKTRLSELLAEVEQGGQVTLTRRGRPVAQLVGWTDEYAVGREPASQHQGVGALIESLREKRRDVSLEGDVATLIADGRD